MTCAHVLSTLCLLECFHAFWMCFLDMCARTPVKYYPGTTPKYYSGTTSKYYSKILLRYYYKVQMTCALNFVPFSPFSVFSCLLDVFSLCCVCFLDMCARTPVKYYPGTTPKYYSGTTSKYYSKILLRYYYKVQMTCAHVLSTLRPLYRCVFMPFGSVFWICVHVLQ